MPRAPATRDQADAYRFGLRRLDAALVRGDPVPLHEQIRSSRRAAFAGVALGLLGLCGVAVYALIVPRPDWRHEAVVTGSPSGALYAVAHDPDRLVPVTDLPAARLVLAALGRGDAGSAVAVAVPDADLASAPRTPASAVAGAVGVAPEMTVAPAWAVCDQVGAEGALLATTVIGGARLPAPAATAGAAPPVGDAGAAPPPGDGGPAGDGGAASAGEDRAGVLLAGPGDTEWLVTAGVRHRVDVGDGALRAAFRLTGRVPRAADPALLSLVPEGVPLATPLVAGRGGPAPAGLPGHVGDVLAGGSDRFVVLGGGLEEVPAGLADLLAIASDAGQVSPVGPDVIGRAPLVADLRVDGWPAGPVRLAEPGDAPVTCWTWTPDRPAGDVWTGAALPVPTGVVPVALAGADGPGDRVDAVAVGAGGAVRATGPGRAAGAGPLWLVSGSGVVHGVADAATAAALGVTVAEPAPEAALKLLPAAPALDAADADQTVDVPPGGPP